MPLPPLPVAIPFLAAGFIAATHTLIRPRISNWIAIAAAAANTIICAFLYLETGSDRIVYWFGGWQPEHGVAVGISFVIDRAGASFATIAGFLVFCAFLFSSQYFDTIRALYHVLMLAFLGAMSGFALTGDLFNLFVFFELMSAAGFALCGYKTEEPGPLQGALNFAVTNTIGGFLALSGIALLYGRTGALNMAQIARALGERADTLVIVAFLLIMCGFFIKAAIVPFHFWLADAHAVAPTPVCILFSGVMVQLGLYAVMRVYWCVFDGSLGAAHSPLRNVLLAAGSLTAIAGAAMCMAQRHIKRLLAFSTISHTGLMLLGFALLVPDGLAGTIVYVAGHAAVKSALFICAGILLHRFSSIDEFDLRGRGRRREPGLALAGVFMALGALGLAGLPPFGTYVGDMLVVDAAKRIGYAWLWGVFAIAEVLTASAVLRVTGRVFLGWGRDAERERDREDKIEEEPETRGGHQHVPPAMLAPAAALLALGLLMGIFTPRLHGISTVAAAQFTDSSGYMARVLDGVRHAQPGPEPLGAIGEAVFRGICVSVAAAAIALLALFRRRIANKFNLWMEPARRLHSGEVGDYVTWVTVGVAVFGAFFVGLFG